MKKMTICSSAICAVLFATGMVPVSPHSAPSGAAAWAQETATLSPLVGVALPKGATRVTGGSLPAGMGRMMAAGAKEFKLPEPDDKSADAEVYFWTGSAYKAGRARFLFTQLQSALTEAGYAVTMMDPSVDNIPNIFDNDAYGTEALDLGFSDPRPMFFHATSVDKKRTLVGLWLDQASKSRIVLAMGEAGFAGAANISAAPSVTNPNAWLVKDFSDAGKGLPAPPLPHFPKLAPKPRTVRGMVKDSNGKPIAGARLVAESSAAGGFRTSFEGRTNAQGIYEIPLPIGICQVVNADGRLHYQGVDMILPLHPADGERDEFDSRPGHIENFVLRTSGAADETGKTGQSYGAPMRILTWNAIEKSVIEVSLEPVGPLADGSSGKTLIFRWKAPPSGLSSEKIIGGIPLGQYKLTARLYDGDDALPLRARKTFRDGADEDPAYASFLDVQFESASAGRATLGRSGFKRFEVTLEP